jgi:hypothetical protein
VETELNSLKKKERAKGGAQVVEYHPSKCKVLSSTPSTTKKRERKKKEMN